jgi:hypothetical protein
MLFSNFSIAKSNLWNINVFSRALNVYCIHDVLHHRFIMKISKAIMFYCSRSVMHSHLVCYAQYQPVNMNNVDPLPARYVLYQPVNMNIADPL